MRKEHFRSINHMRREIVRGNSSLGLRPVQNDREGNGGVWRGNPDTTIIKIAAECGDSAAYSKPFNRPINPLLAVHLGFHISGTALNDEFIIEHHADSGEDSQRSERSPHQLGRNDSSGDSAVALP